MALILGPGFVHGQSLLSMPPLDWPEPGGAEAATPPDASQGAASGLLQTGEEAPGDAGGPSDDGRLQTERPTEPVTSERVPEPGGAPPSGSAEQAQAKPETPEVSQPDSGETVAIVPPGKDPGEAAEGESGGEAAGQAHSTAGDTPQADSGDTVSIPTTGKDPGEAAEGESGGEAAGQAPFTGGDTPQADSRVAPQGELPGDAGRAGLGPTAETFGGNGDPELSDALSALGQLLLMVEEGRGHEAYPSLAVRIPALLERVRFRGGDADALEKELLIHLLRAGDGLAPPEVQERNARRMVEKYPDADGFPAAFFYLTRALFLQGKPLEESFFFDDAALSELAAWMQSAYLTMKAQAAAKEGDVLEAAEYLLAEMELFTGLQGTDAEEVESLLRQANDPDSLDAFLEKHAEVEWLAEAAPFLRARAVVNQGEFGAALLAINRILREGLARTPAQIKSIHAARAEIEARMLIAKRKIGVLLPMSSSSSSLRSLARDTLDGLRMGIRFFGGNAPPRRNGNFFAAAAERASDTERAGQSRTGRLKPFELVIRDTGNNPTRAAKMVEQLATEENVMAIVGPIARSESAAAAEAAEQLGVPIVSLSLTMELPPEARFVFRHSKGQREEMRDLVRYAMDYAGARRFVLLYPDTGYGKKITELFWAAVEEKGGRVVGAEFYRGLRRSPVKRTGELGLKEIFERFTGLDRPQEPEDLALQEELGESGGDPILDFDAIFIPIAPSGSQDLRLIAPYPVTVDAENVLVLGNRFWNSDEVIVAGGGRLDGAIFVDAFDRMGLDPHLREFRRRHRIMFGHRSNFRPPSYYTAFAYDSLGMLMKGLTSDPRQTREGLARWLATMEPYPGVTGLTTFLESGEAVKESMFFRLERDRIRRLNP